MAINTRWRGGVQCKRWIYEFWWWFRKQNVHARISQWMWNRNGNGILTATATTKTAHRDHITRRSTKKELLLNYIVAVSLIFTLACLPRRVYFCAIKIWFRFRSAFSVWLIVGVSHVLFDSILFAESREFYSVEFIRIGLLLMVRCTQYTQHSTERDQQHVLQCALEVKFRWRASWMLNVRVFAIWFECVVVLFFFFSFSVEKKWCIFLHHSHTVICIRSKIYIYTKESNTQFTTANAYQFRFVYTFTHQMAASLPIKCMFFSRHATPQREREILDNKTARTHTLHRYCWIQHCF